MVKSNREFTVCAGFGVVVSLEEQDYLYIYRPLEIPKTGFDKISKAQLH
jgi:hypothetical protein